LLNDGQPPVEPPNELCLARTLDGRLHGTLSLEDAAATELEKAIQNAQTWDGTDDTRSTAERQGDALFDIAAFFNKNHEGDGTRHLPDITSADASTVTAEQPERRTTTPAGQSPACAKVHPCDYTHVIPCAANAPQHLGRAGTRCRATPFRQIAAQDGGAGSLAATAQ
jgi:hypothetical protein